MPGRDGLQLQDRLIGDGHRIPIVILTAHGDSEVRRRALGVGFRANEVRLLLGVIAYNLGNLLRRLALPPYDSELVADEPLTAALQERRAPQPACPILHPPTSRGPLDMESLSADSRAHRTTRVVADLSWDVQRHGQALAHEDGVQRRHDGRHPLPALPAGGSSYRRVTCLPISPTGEVEQ